MTAVLHDVMFNFKEYDFETEAVLLVLVVNVKSYVPSYRVEDVAMVIESV